MSFSEIQRRTTRSVVMPGSVFESISGDCVGWLPSIRAATRFSPRDCTALLWRDHELMAHLNLVGIFQRVTICVEDAHVLVRITVELLADLREIVATLHFVRLPAAALSATCGSAHRSA